MEMRILDNLIIAVAPIYFAWYIGKRGWFKDQKGDGNMISSKQKVYLVDIDNGESYNDY